MLKKTCMAVALAVMVGCGGSSDADGVKYPDLEGTINIDGSSTVFPVSAAAAEEFAKLAPKVKIPVKFSGTGSGFKKFVAGSIEISNASRPIKEKEEKHEHGICRSRQELSNGYLIAKIGFDTEENESSKV